jgi:hypothetical protein
MHGEGHTCVMTPLVAPEENTRVCVYLISARKYHGHPRTIAGHRLCGLGISRGGVQYEQKKAPSCVESAL